MLGIAQLLKAVVPHEHHAAETCHKDSSVLGSLAGLNWQHAESRVSVMHIEQVAGGDSTGSLELDGSMATLNFEESLLIYDTSGLSGGSVSSLRVQ